MRWLDILEEDCEGRLAFFPYGRCGYVISSPRRARWIRIGFEIYFLVYIGFLASFISGKQPMAAAASVLAAVTVFLLGAWLATRGLERTTSRLPYLERMRRQALIRPVLLDWFFVFFGLLTVSAGLIIAMQPWPHWPLGVVAVLFGVYIVVLMIWMITVRTFAGSRGNDPGRNTGS